MRLQVVVVDVVGNISAAAGTISAAQSAQCAFLKYHSAARARPKTPKVIESFEIPEFSRPSIVEDRRNQKEKIKCINGKQPNVSPAVCDMIVKAWIAIKNDKPDPNLSAAAARPHQFCHIKKVAVYPRSIRSIYPPLGLITECSLFEVS